MNMYVYENFRNRDSQFVFITTKKLNTIIKEAKRNENREKNTQCFSRDFHSIFLWANIQVVHRRLRTKIYKYVHNVFNASFLL